jgi:hypothetical protein
MSGDLYRATLTQEIAVPIEVAELLVGRSDDSTGEWLADLERALRDSPPANYRVVRSSVEMQHHGRHPLHLWCVPGPDAAAIEQLAACLAYKLMPPRCELTDRWGACCDGEAVAVRWEHDFADFVCERHAKFAVERGALVVRATKNSREGLTHEG